MTAFKKRINKEIEYFNNKKYLNDNYNNIIKNIFSNCEFNYVEEQEENSNILIYYKTQLIFILKPNICYPFKPYNIVYYKESNNYFRYLVNLNKKIEHNINKNILIFFYTILYQKIPKFLSLNNKDCFCCNSLTCSYIWSPAFTMANVLLEHIEISFIVKYSNPLNYKFISNIYNCLIDKFKLNSDLIELINFKLLLN